jgi:predicted DNA binding CopG/RHH family protein
LHCGIWEVRVKYSELVEGNTTLTEKQEFLTGGEMTAITIRIPKNLKDAAAERASLKGISFSAYARMCMIADLAPEAGKGGAASVG